jgi:uncharacterized membrane protein
VAHEEPEIGSRASDRLISFSDAVVAIAITLLAISLPVPSGLILPAFWASVRNDSGQYLAFLISFVTIAGAWSQHHALFRYARGTDARMRTSHLVWLLTIILIPFATKLLFSKGSDDLTVHALQWGFYSLVQAVGSAALLVMVRRLVSGGLLAPDTPPREVADVTAVSWSQILGFGLSIPVFFVTPDAWALWIAAPLLVHVLRRCRRARDGDGDRHPDQDSGRPEKS